MPAQLWDLILDYAGMLLATVGMLLTLVAATSRRRARRQLHYESWHLLHLYGYLGVGLVIPPVLCTGADFLTSPHASASLQTPSPASLRCRRCRSSVPNSPAPWPASSLPLGCCPHVTASGDSVRSTPPQASTAILVQADAADLRAGLYGARCNALPARRATVAL